MTDSYDFHTRFEIFLAGFWGCLPSSPAESAARWTSQQSVPVEFNAFEWVGSSNS